ncbi:MAG: aminotransferase class V-fold PLP-dependent enzyme [Candidatus Merdivicinus sp.]
MMRRSKEALAGMLHCDACDIAFGQSSTQMFTLVTEGIDYAQGDNVVTVQQGWIGSRFAWQKRQSEGLEVRFVSPQNGAVTPDMLIHACDEHTRAISVNLVESTTGYRIDIDTLGAWCRTHNILLFVDAVQALGVLDVDVARSHMDFVVGNDYKWMMNFCGTGYAYVSPRVRGMIRHWGAGWMSDTDRFNTKKEHICIREDAGRFEIGHQHNDGIYGLGLVAEQNRILGQKNIEAYVLDLAGYFRQLSQETHGVELSYSFAPKNCSQIISIRLKPCVYVTDADFKAAKVFTRIGEPDAGELREVRVGLHCYNNKNDIDRFFDVIRENK